MAHDIDRLLRAAGQGVWAIEPGKAEQIVAGIALRAQMGKRADPAFPVQDREARLPQEDVGGQGKVIRVIRLLGTILPRGNMMSDVSDSGAVSLQAFQEVFRAAAVADDTQAIVIEIDSPGGQIDLVPETAALIRSHRRADRPIVAIANTVAASAAYWIATAADELVVTPSGEVGSIGVYMLHQDVSAALVKEGIAPSFIYEGARKVECSPFGPLSAEARAALQSAVRVTYDQFTADIASARGVSIDVVQADPESGAAHMGGGRVYSAAEAVALNMADRVETFDALIARLQQDASSPRRGARRSGLQAATALRRRLTFT